MQSVKTRFINNFELVRWVTYVFIGGTINASFAQIYADYLLHNPPIFGPLDSTTKLILFLLLPLGLLAVAPLFLSITLTRLKPEKQLIPPLYINLVSLAWFAGFIGTRYPSEIYPVLFLYGFFALFLGIAWNRVASKLLGMSVRPEDFVWYSFSLNALEEKVRDILEPEKIRNNLGVSESETDEEKTLFKGGAGTYNFRIHVSEASGLIKSSITAIFYDVADWYVKPVSDGLKEYAQSMIVYLKDIFQRPENALTVADTPGWTRSVDTDALVSRTMDEMAGVIPLIQKVSRIGWVKIGAYIVALALVAVTGFYFQDIATSVTLFGALMLYLAFELRSSTK